MMKKIIQYGAIGISVCLLICFGLNVYIMEKTKHAIYTSNERIPVARKNLLVLGTSRLRTDKSLNPFFYNRIQKTAELYARFPIQKIIVSGDHRTKFYDEPLAMTEALHALHVPDSIVERDEKGYRTLASIRNWKHRHTTDTVILITQKFHCYRTLYYCQQMNVPAIAIVANDADVQKIWNAYIREYFARINAFFEMW